MIERFGLKLAVILMCFFGVNTSLNARHIIGGEVTYVCNGNGNYTFTMQIYRDCIGNGAEFDSADGGLIGTVSFFRGSQQFGPSTFLDPPFIEFIPPNLDNPCLIVPQNVCVERGTYTFDANLPLSPQSYTVSYSRCCRNNNIANIFFPEITGATYTIELTPMAQSTCNNSPVYNNFPEIIICAGEPLSFDHSATDPEGDQLVYEFCAPFIGGGVAGTQGNGGSFEALNGVAPDPDASPPYIDVDFKVPQFTATRPLGGEPAVTIDPFTGLITGTPIINGQFVVGVCVSEFRNGELLSVVKRDFQFNVTTCDPLVRADIVEDVLIGDKEFLVNVCGQNEFQFENQSVQQSNITDYFWDFEIENETVRYDEWEPIVMFPDTGQYKGVLILNPQTNCGDTATIFVNVFPEIVSDFDLDYDTCIAGPVDFTDFSFTGADQIESWFWEFSDVDTSSFPNPSHLYTTPGIKVVSLTTTDNNNCSNTIDTSFNWSPVPAEIVVQPSSFIACTPGGFVNFNNLTTPIDTTYDIIWNFGEGNSSTEISPSHEFTDVGTFTVTVEITSPFGCEIAETFNNWISIKQGPEADFTFSPDLVTNFDSEVFFTDQSSLDVINWQWDFSGQGASRDQNPSFVFRDTGFQEVVLLVTAPNGCVDTAFARIDVVPINSYHLPNAFSPNFDTKNDTYQGVGTLENIEDFDMKIWSRWGELVFQTDSQFAGWNGQKFNNGPILPSGVYIVLVTYESPRDGTIQIKEYATLIR